MISARPGPVQGLIAFLVVALHAAPALSLDASVLAGPCASCHGPEGISPGEIPSIAGQDRAVLRERLLAFQAGTDTSATVMTRLMKGYTPDQIDALAQWFSEAGK